jgi:hypothetical protein
MRYVFWDKENQKDEGWVHQNFDKQEVDLSFQFVPAKTKHADMPLQAKNLTSKAKGLFQIVPIQQAKYFYTAPTFSANTLWFSKKNFFQKMQHDKKYSLSKADIDRFVLVKNPSTNTNIPNHLLHWSSAVP